MNTSRILPALGAGSPDVRAGLAAVCVLASVTAPAAACQETDDRPPAASKEVWEPVPPVVTPASPNAPGAPPSDAIVLFDGTDLDEWVNTRDGSPAGWRVADGIMTVNNATGSIETRRRFGSYQLHIEWRAPAKVTGSGQARGNSGVFLASPGPGNRGYELQILDSHENETYVNGMAGSIYNQSIPLVNPSRQPGEWQTYDVVWTAPRFAADGSLTAPARVTVLYNGVLVQQDFEIAGETAPDGPPPYFAHGATQIKLQAHGALVAFRNIWVRELP